MDQDVPAAQADNAPAAQAQADNVIAAQADNAEPTAPQPSADADASPNEDNQTPAPDEAPPAPAEAAPSAAVDELDGYRLVGSTNVNHDDGDTKIVFDDLLANVVIESQQGTSCAIDRPAVDSPHGTIRARIIQDAGGRAHIYRQDDTASNTTKFKVAFKHQAL